MTDRRISLGRARNQWDDVVRGVEQGTPTVLINHGRPKACLVTAEWFEAASRAMEAE